MVDVWSEVTAERNDLCDLLEALTPKEWDAQSLCEEWRVRDVVGHLIAGSGKIRYTEVLVGLARSGFSLNKMLARGAIEIGSQPTEDLLKQLREHATSQTRPPMTKADDVLADTLIHAQDIRRPLGKAREIPADRVAAVLDRMKGAPLTGNKKRIAGLRLTATDMEWSHGDGPEVHGPGEALLMAMCGRKSAIDDLTGEGVHTLRARR
jgi:uncharacterized protein (TIGR03083 family)